MQKSYERAASLLAQLSLQEKVGQLVLTVRDKSAPMTGMHQSVVEGRIGAILNEVDPATNAELQRLAREESPHGIPLLIGRDVIHGFKTIMPIPLGMAATWNHDLVEAGAAAAAVEAAAQGINWTFSPMLDVSRDPRWGRVAESFGEDPLLTAKLTRAMVRGYQREGDSRIMSCLKHFVGYGASEGGRDYNTTNIPETELRNVYLPPFLAGIEAGAASVMTSFSDLNGRPVTANAWALRQVLRKEWQFEGFVVSDWLAIAQLVSHGVAEDLEDATRQAASAGVSMDMTSEAYSACLEALIDKGQVDGQLVDALVLEVLAAKYEFGLFDQPLRTYAAAPRTSEADATALQLARESLVLLKNQQGLLPLPQKGKLALIGPLADQPYEQLGTWVFDGDEARSCSVRQALEARLGQRLIYAPGLANSRTKDDAGFAQAIKAAEDADVILAVLGEEAILSGEAHCRADIGLPGWQTALMEQLHALNKPLVSVIMAGRPLTIESVAQQSDALIYAFHPGSQAGPAIADVLLGDWAPTGKLPITIPRAVGQIPIYYAHRNTGRPPTPETVTHIDQIAERAPQESLGNTSFYLDLEPSPAFPFGFGLTYTEFDYAEFEVREGMNSQEDELVLAVKVTNTGARPGQETVQLYMQDPVASITRPVRELKAWQRVSLAPGEASTVEFRLSCQDLCFYNGEDYVTEPGLLRFWAGGSAAARLCTETIVLEG